jgi:hypothetical protein
MLEPPLAMVMVLPETPVQPAAENDLSLGLLAKRQDCAPSETGEIVVCGRRNDNRYRLGPPVIEEPTLMEDVAQGFTIGLLKIAPGRVDGLLNSGVGIQIKIPF